MTRKYEITTTNRCVGTSKMTGERCRKAPIAGATVCRNHGGAAPQVRAAAKRRIAEGFLPAVELHNQIVQDVTATVADRLRAAAKIIDLNLSTHANDQTITHVLSPQLQQILDTSRAQAERDDRADQRRATTAQRNRDVHRRAALENTIDAEVLDEPNADWGRFEEPAEPAILTLVRPTNRLPRVNRPGQPA